MYSDPVLCHEQINARYFSPCSILDHGPHQYMIDPSNDSIISLAGSKLTSCIFQEARIHACHTDHPGRRFGERCETLSWRHSFGHPSLASFPQRGKNGDAKEAGPCMIYMRLKTTQVNYVRARRLKPRGMKETTAVFWSFAFLLHVEGTK
jgi:hypothetical protein